MFEIFIHFGRCTCCLLPPFVKRQLPCLHKNSRNMLLLPPVHPETFGAQKSALWGCKLKVTRHADPQAKTPRTASSQQPACNPKEHQILSTAEAIAFAAQFWDPKVHPSMNFWRRALMMVWSRR